MIRIKALKKIGGWFSLHKILSLILFVLIVPILIVPFYSRYSYLPNGSQSNSYFSKYDYETATWIKNNTPKNAIILSDYFSMKMYQGLSSRPLLFSGLNSGEETPEAQAILKYIKQNILLSPASSDAYYSISSFVKNLTDNNWVSWQEKNTLTSLGITLDNPSILVVINPRTSAWLEQQGISDSREPDYNINQTYLAPFNDTDYFKSVYQLENQVYIYTPRAFLLWHVADYPSAVGQNVDDSEVAYWSMDQGNGLIFFDNSQYGNNGAIFSASLVQGVFGKALKFNDVDTYVNVSDSPSLNPNDGLSIEAWIRPSITGSNNEIIGKLDQFMLRLDPSYELGTVSFFVVTNSSYEPRARGSILPINIWSHVVGTYDGEQIKIYVNGQLAGSSKRSGNIDNTTNPLKIGNVSGHYFNGTVDEIHVYNRALSAKEVEAHYNNTYSKLLRKADVSQDLAGYMVNIPFKVDFSTNGEIKIVSKINVNNLSETAFKCEIYDNTTERLVFEKSILSNSFAKTNEYATLDLGTTKVLDSTHIYQLRIYFTGTVNVWIDSIRFLE
jgi:hypothetical protein